MARYQVLYWQDVPSVVKAFDDDGTELKRELPEWFQQEIDKRAMVQGLTGSDAYLEQWRWGDVEERPGSPGDVLDAIAQELEAEYA
jgi:cvfA/B/C family virulence factor